MISRQRQAYHSLVQREDWQYNIIDYGVNNLYPDVIRELLEQSALADTCRNIIADFISGDGIAEQNIASMAVNSKEQTMSDVLEFAAYELETFGGFSLHLQKNILGKVTEITPLPFQYCRITTDRCRVAVSDNWHGESAENFALVEPIYYPLYGKETPNDIFEGMGCVYYFADTKNANLPYPYSPAHAIIKQIQTDVLLSGQLLNSVKNNFAATMVITTPADFTKEQEHDLRKQVQNVQGEEGGGKVIFMKGLVRDADGNLVSPFKIDTITPTSIDKLHANTDERVKLQIMQKYNVPAELVSSRQGNSLNVSADAIKVAYQYVNNCTKTQRDALARHISKIVGMKITITPKRFLEI